MRSSSLPPTSGTPTRTSMVTVSTASGPDWTRRAVPVISPGLPGMVTSNVASVGEVHSSRCTRSMVAPTNLRANDGTSAVP